MHEHNGRHPGRRRPPGPWRAGALALALLPLLALGGCLEADTLGGKPPDEVQVGSPPHWNNGMGELMTLKCGICHQLPRPKWAPNETPDELDFTIQFGDGGVDGAAEALGDVQEQVLEGTMPQDYATPLTDQEYQAILDWDGS